MVPSRTALPEQLREAAPPAPAPVNGMHEAAAVPAAPKDAAYSVVTEFSSLFSEKFPQVRAACKFGFMVEGPDGTIRRFPFDMNNPHVYEGKWEIMSASLYNQLGYIYDAHSDHVLERISEYRFNSESKEITYEVRGQAVASVIAIIGSNLAIYPLGNGKWMIPQREFRECSQACVEMLLAEGKTESEVLEQIAGSKLSAVLSAVKYHSQSNFMASLQARSGRRVVTVEVPHPAAPDALDGLMREIKANGPCILSCSGHSRIVDSIDKSPEGTYTLVARDPFTGSALRIAMHDEFAQRSVYTPGDRTHWLAIFLSRLPEQPINPSIRQSP